MAQQYIFGTKDFKHRLDDLNLEDIPNLENKRKTITNYIKALESGRIEKTKEEAIQADFLNNFFGDVLGYEYKDSQKWNLEKEHKSKTDSTKTDGALGFFAMLNNDIRADVRAVIELKDALTDLDKPQYRINDKRTPVEQAFSYSSKAGGKCKWVIVSNFKEIRIYHSSDQGAYEKFIVSELIQDENLKRFFYILQKENLISESSESNIEKLYRERQEIEQTITKKFYNEYKILRLELFSHLKANNKEKDELFLFNKTQKLLDRFIFVCFCEYAALLPPNTLKRAKEILKNAFDFEENKLWRQLKGLFQSIDKGNPPLDINRFNGGLFAKDEDLDNLTIQDDILLKLIGFSEYDFASDINVNILGHIFEQSLSDIEEIKTQIGNGGNLSHEEKAEVKKNGKRKKEGIYYTPEYITRYIVKEAVGGWLEDRKKELGFYDLPELTSNDFQSIKLTKKKGNPLSYNETIEKHIAFWEAYKDKLRNIKVLDPACGSGAFLNQVFDFLYREGQSVNDQLSAFRLGQREIFELDKHILTNNIFGVDLNPESVEITKLSLWLKTANKGKELTALEENIRCGNSLIDDNEIAGDKAFNWFMEFPQVFPFYKDKNKHSNDLNKRKIIQSGVLNYPDQGDQDYDDELSEPAYSYKEGSKGFEKYGFDVIIGNPPYIPTENIQENEKAYLSKTFKSAFGRINIFPLFYEKAINLIKQNGIIGFITPYTILKNQYFIEARRVILKNTWIRQIVDFQNKKVFEDAVVDLVILILKKEYTTDKEIVLIENINNFEHQDYTIKAFNQQTIHLHKDLSFLRGQANDLFIKIYSNTKKVSEIIDFNQGIITGDNKRFITKIKTELSKPIITGSDFNRYFLSFSGFFVEYSEALHRPRTKGIFEVAEKILLRQTGSYPICTIDTAGFYTLDTVHNGLIKDEKFNPKYLLCLLNSKLIRYIYEKQINEVGKVFAQVKIIYINEIPIKIIDINGQTPFIEMAEIMFAKSQELEELRDKVFEFYKSKYAIDSPSNKIQNWVELEFSDFIHELSKQKIKLSTSDEYELIQLFEKEIGKVMELKEVLAKTDNEIDKMVYKLYDLNEEEISVFLDTKSA